MLWAGGKVSLIHNQVYKRFIPSKQAKEDVIKSLAQKLGISNYFEELEIINFCGFEYMKYKYIPKVQNVML